MEAELRITPNGCHVLDIYDDGIIEHYWAESIADAYAYAKQQGIEEVTIWN